MSQGNAGPPPGYTVQVSASFAWCWYEQRLFKLQCSWWLWLPPSPLQEVSGKAHAGCLVFLRTLDCLSPRREFPVDLTECHLELVWQGRALSLPCSAELPANLTSPFSHICELLLFTVGPHSDYSFISLKKKKENSGFSGRIKTITKHY